MNNDLEDFANLPSWGERAHRIASSLAEKLLECPEEIRDFLLKDPSKFIEKICVRVPAGEPIKAEKPDTSTLSEIRRNAARARWDAPREKSTRVTVTLPPDVAKKLQAAADASHRPVSRLVAQCIETALPTLLLDTLAEDLKTK